VHGSPGWPRRLSFLGFELIVLRAPPGRADTPERPSPDPCDGGV